MDSLLQCGILLGKLLEVLLPLAKLVLKVLAPSTVQRQPGSASLLDLFLRGSKLGYCRVQCLCGISGLLSLGLLQETQSFRRKVGLVLAELFEEGLHGIWNGRF